MLHERLRTYIDAGLVHQTGNNDSGGLSSRWATFCDGSKARWGYSDNIPYQGSFQSRPEEIAPGSIAEAFFAGEMPSDRLLAIRDASEYYQKTVAFEAEYAAFLAEAVYCRGTKFRYPKTYHGHVMDPGEYLIRAVWNGREYFAHPENADYTMAYLPRKEEVWEKIDLPHPGFVFRECIFARGGRPIQEGAAACP